MTTIAQKVVAIHDALDAASIGHAFGGALALAWCTQRARGTIDIDVNVFLPTQDAAAALAALPAQVECSAKDRKLLERDGQVRVMWANTPVDVFLNTTEYHVQAAARCRFESFDGRDIPFLDCSDLAVFKAFFNRTKDWADLEEMHAAATLDVDAVLGVLVEYLGGEDERIQRLRQLRANGRSF